MLKYYATGNLSKVIEFATSQITRIMLLYSLFRSITENPFIADTSGGAAAGSNSSIFPPNKLNSKLTIPEANIPLTWTAKCPIDLSEHEVPMDQSEFECPIDGTIIKRQ